MPRALREILYESFQRVPARWTSTIGSVLLRADVRLNNPQIIRNARANMRLHRPDMREAEVERAVERFLDNVGRMRAEFAALPRLVPEGRIEVRGVERGRARVGEIPTLSIALHTGNWEVFSPAMQWLGIPIASFYEPPADPIERRIAEAARRSFDMRLLSPDRQGIRDALAVLRSNGVVAIFGDEARHGRTMAPLFGRPPHPHGNLAIAARLARHTGAQIVVIHCERLPGVRFRLHFEPPFFLPEGRPDLLADVAALNAAIEPVILKNLDRWYYLDDSIAPLD